MPHHSVARQLLHSRPMRVLVTGSSGLIGESVIECIGRKAEVIGLDIRPGRFTTRIGDIRDPESVSPLLDGVEAVVHLAALLTPHVGIRSEHEFHQVNVDRTRVLLECALTAGIRRFVFTSTTSVYGCSTRANERATWVTEELAPNPEDVYDRTKLEAESLCQAAARKGMTCIVLRMSRCFPEPDHLMAFYRLYRGVDRRDVAEGHWLALTAQLQGFELFNLSAQSPFQASDCDLLWTDPWSVIQRWFPTAKGTFEKRGWPVPERIDRVYVIDRARDRLGYKPRFNFSAILNGNIA